MPSGTVALLVEHGAGVERAVRLLHRLQHEGAVAESLRPGPGDQTVVQTPLGVRDGVAGHRAHQQGVLPHHGSEVDQPTADWFPCKHSLYTVVGLMTGELVNCRSQPILPILC